MKIRPEASSTNEGRSAAGSSVKITTGLQVAPRSKDRAKRPLQTTSTDPKAFTAMSETSVRRIRKIGGRPARPPVPGPLEGQLASVREIHVGPDEIEPVQVVERRGRDIQADARGNGPGDPAVRRESQLVRRIARAEIRREDKIQKAGLVLEQAGAIVPGEVGVPGNGAERSEGAPPVRRFQDRDRIERAKLPDGARPG